MVKGGISLALYHVIPTHNTSNRMFSALNAVVFLNYFLRWKIEVFHKILRSGFQAEESKLRRSKELVKLITLFRWRIF